jgi:hypothetical protein
MMYDDNYGHWDMGDNSEDRAEMMDFYRRTQRTNVAKRCKRCDRMVNIQPHYAICGSCADAVERGMDY